MPHVAGGRWVGEEAREVDRPVQGGPWRLLLEHGLTLSEVEPFRVLNRVGMTSDLGFMSPFRAQGGERVMESRAGVQVWER